jgi:hypothetical protein
MLAELVQVITEDDIPLNGAYRGLCSNGTKNWEVYLFVLFIGVTEWTQTTLRNGF